MGSKKDTMCRCDMISELQELKQFIPNCHLHIFDEGDHPAMASNAEAAASIITAFLLE